MQTQPLVSIIIPTYNRAHLLGETLDSVLAQTYQNWECIVVDDESTDTTTTLMNAYLIKDPRIQYHKRPKEQLKGGNAARNYGFQLSKGDHIQWFDSDDKMTPDFLSLKVHTFLSEEVDLVISKSKCFGVEDPYVYAYNFKASDINFLSYAIGHIAWKTPDFMVKREVVKNIEFNPKLQAGQEYNFICKLLLKTNSIYMLDNFLTAVRKHENSIGTFRRSNNLLNFKKSFQVYWLTYLDVYREANQRKFNEFCFLKCVLFFYESKNQIKLPKQFHNHGKQIFGMAYSYFLLGSFVNKLFGKYHYFYSQLKRSKA